MATYAQLIEKALSAAHNPTHRQVAQAAAVALRSLAPTKPWGKDMANELIRENDAGALVSGCPDLDAEAPADLYRIVWNSCNATIRLAQLR